MDEDAVRLDAGAGGVRRLQRFSPLKMTAPQLFDELWLLLDRVIDPCDKVWWLLVSYS